MVIFNSYFDITRGYWSTKPTAEQNREPASPMTKPALEPSILCKAGERLRFLGKKVPMLWEFQAKWGLGRMQKASRDDDDTSKQRDFSRNHFKKSGNI